MLLWITIMNQSQDSKLVIRNVPLLFERLELKREFKILSYDGIYNAMTVPTILHRFPKKMSQYLTESLLIISDKFESNAANIFVERNKIVENLLLFKGIGKHKADIALYIYDCVKTHQINSPKHLNCKMSQEEVLEEVTFIGNLSDFVS